MSAANTRPSGPPLGSSSAETGKIERGEPAASSTPLPLRAPAVLRERYEILSRIGSGGLGVVFAAWDRQLERNVAVKLVRPRARSTERAGRIRARVLREARSLARLSHPNVVSVFDVGDYGTAGSDAGVFIAMELIEGDTLSAWLLGDRSQEEIVDVFDQAGRGLAAAHASDLVHRDFKPDNVMITDKGVVKVLDFGLARVPALTSESISQTTGLEVVVNEELDADRLTRTGVVMGTPRYMAPEQHADAEVGAAADQFAFCVALLGALQGCAVYEGPTFRELALAKHHEEIRAPQGRDPTPPRIRRVLRRGLRAMPWQRWPSMEHLLVALQAPRVRPWRWIGAGAVGAAVVGGGALAWSAGPATGCESQREPLRGVWNEAARERTSRALPEASAVFGADAWQRLEPRLVQFVERWESTYADACDAHGDGRVEDAAFDAQMACLGRGRDALGTVMELLAEADLDLAARAPNMVETLPDPRSCERSTSTPGVSMNDGEVALTVRAVEQALAQISTWTVAGRLDAAGFRLGEARRRLEAHDLPHLDTQLDLAEGRLEVAKGRYDQAEVHFAAALARAAANGFDAFAAEAAIEHLECVGIYGARSFDALELADHAQAWVERAGGDLPTRARLLGVRGRLLEREARYREALTVLTQALGLLEESGAHTLARAGALANLADTLAALGRFDEATDRMTEALAMTHNVHGQAHPATADAVLRLAAIADDAEHYEDAARGYQRALAQFEAALGREHPKVAAALLGWAEIIGSEGRMVEAGPLLLRAREIRVRAFGADDPRVAEVLTAIALNQLRQGDVESALQGHRAALQMYERTLGSKHDKVGDVMVAISRELHLHGRKQESRDYVDRAHTLLSDKMGADHPSTVRAELLQGYYAIEDGDFVRAELLFEGALEHARSRHHDKHPSIARAHYGLAAGLQERREWDAAQRHLEQVLVILEAAGQSGDFNDKALLRIWNGWVRQGRRSEASRAGRARLAALEAGAWPQDQIPAVRAWVEAHSDAPAAAEP